MLKSESASGERSDKHIDKLEGKIQSLDKQIEQFEKLAKTA